ncbi:MAG: hypothetical protein Salg2KO_14450 [Salibacteraceae bacterium]
MKAFLFCVLTLAVVSSFSNNVQAQCTPDSNMQGLYQPDFDEGLPPAKYDRPYETVIHVRVPSDTTLPFVGTVSIDSAIFQDVDGLPTGITYECDQPRCSYPGGAYGCILLSGIPSDSNQIGVNDLEVRIAVYAFGQSFSDEMNEYSITVEEGWATQITEYNTHELALSVSSNPVQDGASLRFELPNSGEYSVRLYSLLGSEVGMENGYAPQTNLNQIALDKFQLNSGVYFAVVSQGAYSKSLRFIVR